MAAYYIHYIYYLHLKERINFNIIRQENNDAFKAKFVAVHLVLRSWYKLTCNDNFSYTSKSGWSCKSYAIMTAILSTQFLWRFILSAVLLFPCLNLFFRIAKPFIRVKKVSWRLLTRPSHFFNSIDWPFLVVIILVGSPESEKRKPCEY